MGSGRKHLSATSLLQTVYDCFKKQEPTSSRNTLYSALDCLMSCVAVFFLKFPSLLQFDLARQADALPKNIKRFFMIDKIPCDTTMRARLDEMDPNVLRTAFKKIFAQLQRGKVLEVYRYLGGRYILSVDGTGHYSSSKVHCDQCCKKTHRNGKVTYYHQMLSAAIVHPDRREVFPVMPEPITKQDGTSKNDCERNAAKRFFEDLRREHPHLKFLVVEDGLASNFPHLDLLDSLKIDYIVGAKPGDHKFMFDWISGLKGGELIEERDGVEHSYRWYKNVPLNDGNFDYRVQVLCYTQKSSKGKELNFSWVTNLELSEENVYEVMRAGRARWRIENEVFNTLKNQGYNFEHNYGHGYKNLCTMMGTIMMLVFLIDQVQKVCSKVYNRALKKTFILRNLFHYFLVIAWVMEWSSVDELYGYIGMGGGVPPPE